MPIPVLDVGYVETNGCGTRSLRNTGRQIINAESVVLTMCAEIIYSKHDGGCVPGVSPHRNGEPASSENNEARTKLEETL